MVDVKEETATEKTITLSGGAYVDLFQVAARVVSTAQTEGWKVVYISGGGAGPDGPPFLYITLEKSNG